jgi:hypothetical protein
MDAKFFKQFAEQDAAIKTPPAFTQLVGDCGWQKSDGPIEGVFMDKKLGHKCAWSVRWAEYGGLKTPDFFLPVDAMTSTQMVYEAYDAAYSKGEPLVARLLVELWTGIPDGHQERWLDQMREAIRDARQRADEFTSPWSPPPASGHVGRAMGIKVRPTWGSHETILQLAQAAPQIEVIHGRINFGEGGGKVTTATQGNLELNPRALGGK